MYLIRQLERRLNQGVTGDPHPPRWGKWKRQQSERRCSDLFPHKASMNTPQSWRSCCTKVAMWDQTSNCSIYQNSSPEMDSGDLRVAVEHTWLDTLGAVFAVSRQCQDGPEPHYAAPLDPFLYHTRDRGLRSYLLEQVSECQVSYSQHFVVQDHPTSLESISIDHFWLLDHTICDW